MEDREEREMSDYDLRQLRLMRDSLARFDTRNTNLERLLELYTHLCALLRNLEHVANEWKELVQGLLWRLDMVYDNAICEGRTALTDHDVEVVSNAVEKLRHLVSALIPPEAEQELDD